MRAILEHDIIRHITESGDTEIGTIPADKKDVGLERLRFDGTTIVDLADLTGIWVSPLGAGFFELHAVPVPGSQKVAMTYGDRKNLTMENGIIRVKTAQELDAERQAEQALMIKNRLRQAFKRDVGDVEDQLADAYKLIYLLIMVVMSGDQGARDFLSQILPDVKATYPLEKIGSQLGDAAGRIKVLMGGYYDEIQDI